MELIAEHGFSATTVEDIALRAGVAKGTVYYNFPSKNALFEQLLRHGVGLLTADFRAAVEGVAPPEAVLALIRAELAYIERHRSFAQLLLSEMWRTNREWHQTLQLLRSEAVDVIADVLRRGVREGQFDPALDVRMAAAALFGVCLVVAVDWLVFEPDRSLADVQDALITVIRARVGV
ncbi:helix-turn-helix transcriptional regulator [Dactylosporangium aurantiacum]|uniref:Helix-turn-helix transcriptional regulator n=2 Tax=Dactylosporangium aurantiacum TaxID=35754 RepID=A0A9Q9IPQ1_9ACTN|nr:TetR/AcrR family transcriptional regulator [Dactylosporangium aurantiacum]MDG6108423.1 TetR/AcrR family transcriptional regulator [Dactylosporangium aurantiacum]UWZ59571.1 helix-turn-helix transcriptional regulator [Dactylosporangium aurantiacum]